jgi:hypothetical protein
MVGLILSGVSTTAISHTIDTAKRIVYLRINREPTMAEAEEGLLMAFQDPLYQAGFTCLVDRTLAGPPSKEHVYRLTEIFNRHRHILTPSRVAVIVASPAAHGMFRMLQALNHDMPSELNIFNSQAEGEQWLCQPPSKPAP